MDKNPIERNEYISLYVTKEEKRRIEDAKDNHIMQMEIVKEIFTSEKDFLKSEYIIMEEELLKYRAYLVTVRQAYKEAQTEQQQKLEEFWSAFYDNLPKVKSKVQRIVDELLPVMDQVKAIGKGLEDINTWRIKDILEVVDKIAEMTPEKVKMFQVLVDNFKLPKP